MCKGPTCRRDTLAATSIAKHSRLSRLGFHLLKIFLLRQNFGTHERRPSCMAAASLRRAFFKRLERCRRQSG